MTNIVSFSCQDPPPKFTTIVSFPSAFRVTRFRIPVSRPVTFGTCVRGWFQGGWFQTVPVSVKKTLLRRWRQMGENAFRAPNQGLDSSLSCGIAGQRLAYKECVFSQTPVSCHVMLCWITTLSCLYTSTLPFVYIRHHYKFNICHTPLCNMFRYVELTYVIVINLTFLHIIVETLQRRRAAAPREGHLYYH